MSKIKFNLGWLAAGIIAGLPVVFWLTARPLATRFASSYIVFSSFGQLCGLTGMALFCVVLIMQTRWRFLDKIFNGLNRAYIAHHWFGGLAFILLLIHPLFLAIRYLTITFSLPAAANFLLPSTNNWPNTFGQIGLFLMMVFLIITFFTNLRYHIWKFTHKFLGLAFFFAGLHSLFITSDISLYQPLRIYMLALAAIGLAAYAYRVFFHDLLVVKYLYKINKIISRGADIWEISLAPLDQTLKYQPGQFVFINFQQPGFSREIHPFSLSSDPRDPNLKIDVKVLGDYTKNLAKLQVGTQAKIEGPFGKFSGVNFTNQKQIWIAGGIGITPFLGMARTRLPEGFAVQLFYCVKNQAEAVFLEELMALTNNKNKGLRVQPVYSDTMGRPTAALLIKDDDQYKNKEIFICGPGAMMSALKQQFIELGVAPDQLHSEEFYL